MNGKELSDMISIMETMCYKKGKKVLSQKEIDTVLKAQDIIRKANKSYYVDSEEILSDYMYDRVKKLIESVESTYKELKSDVTDTIGAGVAYGTKVKHEVPMLSLSNTYNEEELNDWVVKSSATGDKDVIIESKLDGCSISLIYKKGKLVQALSRGSGEIGEDVTQNVVEIRDIPKTISLKDDITIRGEILMSYKSFIDNNMNLMKAKEKPFANPRNAASGTLRQKDPKVVRDRNLSAMMYQIINPTKYNINTEEEVLKYLVKLGFRVPYHFYAKFGTYGKFVNDNTVVKDSKEFPCDGLVFKLNNFSDQFRLGVTNKAPRYAVAYKFPPKEVKTKLNSVSWQLGRTGKLTPVAEFEPIIIDGTVVSRATLNNYKYLINSKLRINDIINVVKAAEIIPKIEGIDMNARKVMTTFPIEIPSECPCCGSKLRKGETDLICDNSECYDVKLAKFEFFVSRDGINIQGIGTAVLKDAMNTGLVKTFTDIIKLKDKSHIMLAWDGYSSKGVENIVNSINEAVKACRYEDLFASLNIPLIGHTASKTLIKAFPSFSELIDNLEHEKVLKELLGDLTASSLIRYFKDKKNIDMMYEFERLGFKLSKEVVKSKYSGKKVCITGSIDGYVRSDIERYLDETFGIIVTNNVGPNTMFLIIGAKPTDSKVTKATNLNIPILSYDEFLKELDK